MHIRPSLIRKINLFLAIVTLALLGFLAYLHFFEEESSVPGHTSEQAPGPVIAPPLLPCSFQSKEEAYIALGAPLLSLEKQTVKSQLPDLRTTLISYGISCRPDAPKEKSQILLGIRGQHVPFSIRLNEKAYIKYESKPGHQRWSFSENNAVTPIWVEPEVQQGQVIVRLKMNDAQGKTIEDPYEHSYFALAEIDLPMAGAAIQGWEIESERVDGSLLMRQKAKWYGQDRFLQTYGGDEYAFAKDRERVEFNEGENRYVCFLKAGDLLAFSNGKWCRSEPGPLSENKPLLEVKRVSEQSILFHLWDEEGKRKISLELHKTPEASMPASKVDIKLVGARSRRDWIAEHAAKRFLLRTDDWLLFHDGIYEKVSTQQQIDDYVAGVLRGELIVFEGIEKQGPEVCLVGNRFNDTKTKIDAVSIALYKSWESEKPQGQASAEESLSNQKKDRQNTSGKRKNDSQDDDFDEDDELDDDYEDDDDDYI